MPSRPFLQVDVFSPQPYCGNPVAVILEADGLRSEEMQRLARWTNLSETTFVLAPTDKADYRVRIFTPVTELPFAGHPTLGTCHAWLQSGGAPRSGEVIVQQCGVGLVSVRPDGDRLAFAAPPLRRSGAVEESLMSEIAAALRIPRADIVDGHWVDNGPGWVAVMLADADAVLAVDPGFIDLNLGLIAPQPPGHECAFEVRAFFPKDGVLAEDPVTGSLNAGLAQWQLASGGLRAPYVVSQGTALGRRGRVHVAQDGDGTIWLGGATHSWVVGRIEV